MTKSTKAMRDLINVVKANLLNEGTPAGTPGGAMGRSISRRRLNELEWHDNPDNFKSLQNKVTPAAPNTGVAEPPGKSLPRRFALTLKLHFRNVEGIDALINWISKNYTIVSERETDEWLNIVVINITDVPFRDKEKVEQARTEIWHKAQVLCPAAIKKDPRSMANPSGEVGQFLKYHP